MCFIGLVVVISPLPLGHSVTSTWVFWGTFPSGSQLFPGAPGVALHTHRTNARAARLVRAELPLDAGAQGSAAGWGAVPVPGPCAHRLPTNNYKTVPQTDVSSLQPHLLGGKSRGYSQLHFHRHQPELQLFSLLSSNRDSSSFTELGCEVAHQPQYLPGAQTQVRLGQVLVTTFLCLALRACFRCCHLKPYMTLPLLEISECFTLVWKINSELGQAEVQLFSILLKRKYTHLSLAEGSREPRARLLQRVYASMFVQRKEIVFLRGACF